MAGTWYLTFAGPSITSPLKITLAWSGVSVIFTLCGTPACLLSKTSSNGRPAGTTSVPVSNEAAVLALISGTAGTASAVGPADGGVRPLRKPRPIGARATRKPVAITPANTGTSRRGQTLDGSCVAGM